MLYERFEVSFFQSGVGKGLVCVRLDDIEWFASGVQDEQGDAE